ncbi:FmdE family protein [Myxococcota bacterium]
MAMRTTVYVGWLGLVLVGLTLPNSSLVADSSASASPAERDGRASEVEEEYYFWKAVGAHAAGLARSMLWRRGIRPSPNDWIALSNAGYAEVEGRATQGGLDGLAQVIPIRRGDHSLLEVRSAPNAALWFAVCHKPSVTCAYFQVDPAAVADAGWFRQVPERNLFAVNAVETVRAQHLYENASECAEKFDQQVFGGNEFRIVTIANAVAAGAPTSAVRAMEFHDHFCPGVSSGVLLASYLKQAFPLEPGGSYFLHSVQPWCKEDALLVLLNATPGKGGYAVTYSAEDDRAQWRAEVQDAATIVYRKQPDTGEWDGIVVGFVWGDTGCPNYGHSVLDKLCSDLWYLNQAKHPEQFVRVLQEFELPPDVQPRDYARPGVDPMEMLGLTQ